MSNKFDEDLSNVGSFVCPSCGIMPEIQGPTKNCFDVEGCFSFVSDEDDPEETDDEYSDEEEDELEELNF